MKPRFEDELRIKRHIIRKLIKRDSWENTYINKHLATKGIQRHLLGVVNNILDNLWKEGYIQFHKKKECISLNTSKKNEILKMLEV